MGGLGVFTFHANVTVTRVPDAVVDVAVYILCLIQDDEVDVFSFQSVLSGTSGMTKP